MTPEIKIALQRLLEKVEAQKDKPGPRILDVGFNTKKKEPFLKCYGKGSIEELHTKYDPELREFIELTKK